MSPESKDGIASPNSFISVDDRRKQVVLNDPRDPSSKLTNAPPKMFAFDHVFAEDAAQVISQKTQAPFKKFTKITFKSESAFSD